MVQHAIIWGGTGQAKVVRPILESQGIKVSAIFDNAPGIPSPFKDVPILGGMDAFQSEAEDFEGYGFIVAIGGANGYTRLDISRTLERAKLVPLSAIHKSAHVAETAFIGKAVQIMPMAAICEEAEIGDFCIINTKASVDHECRLGNGAHIMPGATLAGCVEVGDCATIGSGAVILPRIRIGAGAMIGAGAVVTKDIERDVTVVGCPARPISGYRATTAA